jgi:NTE family protein
MQSPPTHCPGTLAKAKSALSRFVPTGFQRHVCGFLLASGLWSGASMATPQTEPGTAETPAKERPRVGLALSGGGARGFSHVGVLKALEALRIPVDCIVGTSAGAAVGAAYAIGHSPQAIEDRLRQLDWRNDMFNDQPSRAELPFRRKESGKSDPLTVTLGVGPEGLKGNTGLVAGQKVELFLHGLFGHSVEWATFDDLPIPFRAVTTDLTTGHMALQGQGSLVQAVRASMAVPTAFSPVASQEQLLVDGGLTQNLPVQAVRETCADRVIAVNIGSPLLKASELNGVFAVAFQMISLLMERNVNDSLAALRPGDVLITPDLSQLSAVDFEQGLKGIPQGEQATWAAAEALRPLQLDEAAYAAWQHHRQASRPVWPEITRISVAPTTYVAPAYFQLQASEALNTQGELDVEGLHQRIRQWTASGDFSSIGYTVRHWGSGHGLVITPQESAAGPDYLEVGAAGHTDSLGNSDFSIHTAFRRKWLNRWGAEWLTVARFGEKRRLVTEWFQPLGLDTGWYLQPRLALHREPLRVFVNDRAVGEFEVKRRSVELGWGVQNHLGDARLSWVKSHYQIKPYIGLNTLGRTERNDTGLQLRLAVDRLDDADFPRLGHAAVAEVFHGLQADGHASDNRTVGLEGTVVRTWGAHTLRASGRWQQVRPDSNQLVGVGGMFNLSGYQSGQFLGKEVGLAMLSYYKRLVDLPQPLGSGLFAGASLEMARIGDPVGYAGNALYRVGGLLYVGAATGLGPAYLGLGVGRGGQPVLYLSLGRL